MPSLKPPVRLRFNEVKATQAAARLLMRHGGEMNCMKLIKLLYLIDRESLSRWGRPVSTDRYFSMDKGPVLSEILDLVNHPRRPHVASPWRDIVSEPHGNSVSLLSNGAPPNDELSRAEEDLIDEVYAEHGSKNPWALAAFVHELPEWKNPHGSSIPITYEDILKAVGKKDDEIQEIESELEAASKAERLFADS